MRNVSDKSQITEKECVFNAKRMCEEHNCEAKGIKLKVLRWRYIDSRKCFANVQVTQNVLQCTAKRCVLLGPDISPTVQVYSDKSEDALGRISQQQQGVQGKVSVIQRDWSVDTQEDGNSDVIGREKA